MSDTSMTRRGLTAAGAAAGLGLMARGLGAVAGPETPASGAAPAPAIEHGRLRQSVCKWCYPKLSVEELCAAAAALGLQSVELLGPDDDGRAGRLGRDLADVDAGQAEGRLRRAEDRVEFFRDPGRGAAVGSAVAADPRASSPSSATESSSADSSGVSRPASRRSAT